MKRAMLGSIVVVGLVMAAAVAGDPRSEGFARMAPASGVQSGTELIVVPATLGDRGQMLTVVDPRQRVMGVYHIDVAGKIALRSVRNLTMDLQMECYDNEGLLPREIRSMSDKR
jgi:hypothetical protein